MKNSDFWNRITYLNGSQTSPVVLWMQYSVISTRITCLYGHQPLSMVFACKTETFGTELQVSMGPRPHLWFLNANQRHLDRINKSLWVPHLTCHFVHAKRRDLHQNDYGFQPSSVVLCMQNCGFRIRLTSLYGSKTPHVVFACKTAPSGPEERVSIVPRHDLSLCACNTAWLAPE